MSSGRSAPVIRTGGPASQCAETTTTARGRGNFGPSSSSAREYSSSWTAVIGDPWETKTTGMRAIKRITPREGAPIPWIGYFQGWSE